MSEHFDEEFPLDQTLCKNCIYRFTRIIVPLDYEAYNINPDDFDIPEGEDLVVEQNTCLVVHEDLDAVVKACNHFKDAKDISFFSTNPY